MFINQSSSLATATGLALMLLLACGVAQAAPADNESVTQTKIVSTAGLDLSTAGGRATLAHRIELAAREVCGLSDGGVTMASAEYEACHRDAVSNASAKIDVLVARLHTTDRRLAEQEVTGP